MSPEALHPEPVPAPAELDVWVWITVWPNRDGGRPYISVTAQQTRDDAERIGPGEIAMANGAPRLFRLVVPS